MCMSNLKSPEDLQSHFEEKHATPDPPDTQPSINGKWWDNALLLLLLHKFHYLHNQIFIIAKLFWPGNNQVTGL